MGAGVPCVGQSAVPPQHRALLRGLAGARRGRRALLHPAGEVRGAPGHAHQLRGGRLHGTRAPGGAETGAVPC